MIRDEGDFKESLFIDIQGYEECEGVEAGGIVLEKCVFFFRCEWGDTDKQKNEGEE